MSKPRIGGEIRADTGQGLSEMPSAATRKRTSIFIYVFGALGGLLFGYDTGIIAGALLYLSQDLGLGVLSQGLVVSAILLGAMVGGGSGGSLADWLGRRKPVLIAAALFSIGAIGVALAPNVAVLVLFRFVLGLAVGVCSILVPLYLSEMSPTEARGAVTSLNSGAIVFGIVLANLVAYALAGAEAWRWMLGLAIIPSMMMLVGMLLMPETPRWLVKRGRESEARAVLRLTRDEARVEEELAGIREIERIERQESSFGELRAGWVRPLLMLGIGLAVAQQITGINAIIYYIPTTLTTSVGISNAQAILANAGISTLGLIAVAILIVTKFPDRVGRKLLLLGGVAGMTVSLAILGLSSLILQPGSESLAWIVIASSAGVLIAFQFSWGPVLWVILSEIFPLRIRGTAMSLAVIFHWGANALVSQTFPSLLEAVGPGFTFLGFAFIGIAVFVFVYLLVAETKGRSLEQIEKDIRQKSAAT